jgi:hypothetical protein
MQLRLQSITMHFAMQEILQKYDGSLESGEIVLDEKSAETYSLHRRLCAMTRQDTNKLPK